jgi:hypothetical protein
MTYKLRDTELVTEPVRIAFPSLFRPKPRFPGSDRETFQAVLLLPPDTDMQPYIHAIKAAMVTKWNKTIQLPGDKSPIRDAGEKSEIDGYEEGWKFINVHSGYAPGLVDQKRQQILDEDRIYAGCWCRFHLTAYGWDHPVGGRGVSFSLNGVQFARDDTRLDGRVAASDVFDALDIEDDEGVDSGDLDELFGS